MKKIIVALLFILVAGCSNESGHVKEGKDEFHNPNFKVESTYEEKKDVQNAPSNEVRVHSQKEQEIINKHFSKIHEHGATGKQEGLSDLKQILSNSKQ